MASKEISDVSIAQKEVSVAETSVPSSPSTSVNNINQAPNTPLPPTDPEKPETKPTPPPYTAFTPSRQIFIILIATAAGFFSPLTGAVYLPSLILFEKVFNTTSTVINATITVYMAVFAVAPLFGAAASDYGGRKTVYVVTLAIFLVANAILAGVPPNLGALFVLRVFQVCPLFCKRKLRLIQIGLGVFDGDGGRRWDCCRYHRACEKGLEDGYISSWAPTRSSSWATYWRPIFDNGTLEVDLRISL